MQENRIDTFFKNVTEGAVSGLTGGGGWKKKLAKTAIEIGGELGKTAVHAVKNHVAVKFEEKKIDLSQRAIQVQQQADQHNLNMQQRVDQHNMQIELHDKQMAESNNNRNTLLGGLFFALSAIILMKDDNLSEANFLKVYMLTLLVAGIYFLNKGTNTATTRPMLFSRQTQLPPAIEEVDAPLNRQNNL